MVQARDPWAVSFSELTHTGSISEWYFTLQEFLQVIFVWKK